MSTPRVPDENSFISFEPLRDAMSSFLDIQFGLRNDDINLALPMVVRHAEIPQTCQKH